MRVDIVCAVFDGALYLTDFIESIQAQSHADWRLWLWDDGSSDGSVDLLRSAGRADPRITLLHAGGPRVGATRGFGWLLEHLPADATYVMCADQDDVWLPHKIARTLSAMLAAEAQAPVSTPVLVHTDLAVVDAELRRLHASLWEFQRITPEPATLRRIAVRNVVTGAALMVNRPALDLALPIPERALFHDWWLALVAAAFGHVGIVPEATVLYRQHDSNAVGARDRRLAPGRLLRFVRHALTTGADFRRDLGACADQAAVFLERYEAQLSAEDTRFLRAFARLPRRTLMRRKLDLLRIRVMPEQGLLDALGVLWRG
jgi:glycosyltransferase involved in cell wall biosynthesis